MTTLSDKVITSDFLSPTGDGSGLTNVPKPHRPVDVSGATPSLNVGTYNFFDQGVLSQDTTVSFTSVPEDAEWQYSYVAGVDSASAFDLANASYSGKSFSVTSQSPQPKSMYFNTEGTKMFVVDQSNQNVFEYDLSSEFDVSTSVYSSNSFYVGSQDSSPQGISFNTDGTSMFVVGNDNDNVFQYTLSTGFDISTASYASKSFSVTPQETVAIGIYFSPDGTKMFIVGYSDAVYQYTLSTGFDVSTASYDSKSLDVSAQESSTTGVSFNTEGTTLIISGENSDAVYQYTLSTGFDVSTASYASKSFSVSSQVSSSYGVNFSPDGTKMFIVGFDTDTIFQYTLAEAAALTLPTIVGTPSTPAVGDRVTYTFTTTDSGTTVNLNVEDIIQ